ncbi:MAG: ATP-binding protein [Fibrobacterota bacterium]|nr:ATP-binding protein [Fibrobacterota bacterium]
MPLRVLLIDENPDDRAMTLLALRIDFPGLDATEILDADGLLSAFAEGRYDIAIIDHHFTWSNGLEVLPRIKQRQPDCPVIMFTATGSEEIAVKALKSGVDDYVVKSSRNFSLLASAVRTALERKRENKRSMLLNVRLQDLLTRLHVGICRSDLNGKLIYANPSFLKMFGLPRDASKRGIDITTLLPIPGGTANWRVDLKRDGQIRRPEIEVKLPGGKTAWLAITLSISGLTDEEGVIETLVEDVTERNRMDRELRFREEEIRQLQKLESIGRLAGGVAHDFNNLLTAINGYSELLLGMLDEHNPLRVSLLEIKKAGTRAAGLTKELLAFSRRQMLQPKVIDLNTLILSLEPLLRRTLGLRIGLDLHLDPNPLMIRCDPAQLENVMMNLASNVRDAIADSGKMRIQSGTMQVREKPEYLAFRRIAENPTDAMAVGSYVVLTIQDSGMGMDAKTLSQIFEPFFTTKGMGKGTGMGLSTAYGIVKQSGGHIFVESELGQGTTFRIYLPSLVAAEALRPPVHGQTDRSPESRSLTNTG